LSAVNDRASCFRISARAHPPLTNAPRLRILLGWDAAACSGDRRTARLNWLRRGFAERSHWRLREYGGLFVVDQLEDGHYLGAELCAGMGSEFLQGRRH
jgi:hypothetical protein